MTPITYQVSIPNPADHLIHVTMTIPDVAAPLDVALPCWTPGSYLMREFARQIEALDAHSLDGHALTCRKVRKETWRIDLLDAQVETTTVVVNYRINAQELGVRQPYLDDEMAFFLGVNLFTFVVGHQDRPLEVTIQLPEHSPWRVFSSRVQGFVGEHFTCESYDLLADTPVLITNATLHTFDVLDRPHGFVVAGECRMDTARVIEETQALIKATADLFGGTLPYERYLFITLISDNVRGGLEHRDSVALVYPRVAFRHDKVHQDFMTLIAHEFFHVWNVKRIHTDALNEPFDYRHEAYTRDLWIAEGWTSYYQFILMRRAGLLDPQGVLDGLAKRIHRYESLPGRKVQSLSDSSFDAWIKLYRQDGHSPNAIISYYLKGLLVALALDMQVRLRSQDKHTLDDVLTHLWTHFGSQGVGFPEGTMQAQVNAVVPSDWQAWFDDHVHSTSPLVWEDIFAALGLVVGVSVPDDGLPSLGVSLKGTVLKTVFRGSPAEHAGLMMGDELIAIDGYRLNPLNDVLQSYQPGDEVAITFWRRGRLRTTSLTLGHPESNNHTLTVRSDINDEQAARLCKWLGDEAQALIDASRSTSDSSV